MLELIRQAVREELAMLRGPLLATVSTVYAHEADDDTANYDADLTLKHDGLELKRVPIAVPHIGVVSPPRVGDLVMVQFLDHDLQQAFVTGRFYHEDDRPPLFKEDEVLFEHRVSDGTINHLRFAADGAMYLQRDVTKPEDNSEFVAGVKIAADGEIEIKSDGQPVTVICDEMTVDGKLTVTGDAVLQGTLKVGTGTGVTIDGTDITGGPV